MGPASLGVLGRRLGLMSEKQGLSSHGTQLPRHAEFHTYSDLPPICHIDLIVLAAGEGGATDPQLCLPRGWKGLVYNLLSCVGIQCQHSKRKVGARD
jgi:hypothetical protein